MTTDGKCFLYEKREGEPKNYEYCKAKTDSNFNGAMKDCTNCEIRKTVEDAISNYKTDEYNSLAKIYHIYKQIPKREWRVYEEGTIKDMLLEELKKTVDPNHKIMTIREARLPDDYYYYYYKMPNFERKRKKIPTSILRSIEKKGQVTGYKQIFLDAVASKIGKTVKDLEINLMAYAAAECEANKDCPYKPIIEKQKRGK